VVPFSKSGAVCRVIAFSWTGGVIKTAGGFVGRFIYGGFILNLAAVLCIHPKLGFKKYGNGIHPPICFLFKCVSKVRPTSMPRRPCCQFPGELPGIIAFPGSEPF
jgi:hypothetical protein